MEGWEINTERLAIWGERICTVSSTDAAEMVWEFGIPGRMVPRLHSFLIEPPLPGTIEVQSKVDDGEFVALDIQLDGASLTHADLEARFGRGISSPRVHWDSAFTLTYWLGVPDAPYACQISAEFATEPAGDTPVSGIALRRQSPELMQAYVRQWSL